APAGAVERHGLLQLSVGADRAFLRAAVAWIEHHPRAGSRRGSGEERSAKKRQGREHPPRHVTGNRSSGLLHLDVLPLGAGLLKTSQGGGRPPRQVFLRDGCPTYLAGGVAFVSSVFFSFSVVDFFSDLVEPLPPIPVSWVEGLAAVPFVASVLFCVVLFSVLFVSSARAVPTNTSASAAVSPMMNRFMRVLLGASVSQTGHGSAGGKADVHSTSMPARPRSNSPMIPAST